MAEKSKVPRCKCGKVLGRGISAEACAQSAGGTRKRVTSKENARYGQ